MAVKLLLRFSKKGALKYTGHLDLLRAFQRSIRRAGLIAAYSQGFNPHMLLSFALPLPLGMESENDYAALALEARLPEDEIISRFNDSAPEGLLLTGVKPVAEGSPGIAAVTAAADYAVFMPRLSEFNPESLLSRPSIILPKKTKSGVKDTDIRPDIFGLRVISEQGRGFLFMRLSAGSERFLNPKLVIGLITENAEHVPVARLELYDKNFTPLFETRRGAL